MRRSTTVGTLGPIALAALVGGAGCGSSSDESTPLAGSGAGAQSASGATTGSGGAAQGTTSGAGGAGASGSSSSGGGATGGSGGGNDDTPFAAQRAGCVFKQGALPSETFGPSIANLAIPIDHIVIVSQENRSFDNYLAKLPAYGQPDADVLDPTVKLVDSNGMSHSPFHTTDYCTLDPKHGWDSMHLDYNSGANDGFVKVNDPNGYWTLGYFDATDLTFYYAMANTYAVGDRYFSAMLGPTGPNRLYLYAGTSSGHIENGHSVASGQPSIFKRLKAAGVSYGVYSGASGTAANCPGPYSFETSMFCGDNAQGAKTLSDFVSDAQADKLPSVVWIYAGSDEHPTADPQNGEKDVQKFFNALAQSPSWAHAAFILTYDEDGGFYDHVPPPPACTPDDIAPLIPAEGSYDASFDRYGFRVPFIVASPYAKAHFVSHVVNSHTSILRFIELRFKLPAVSNRDANESALLEFFDFSSPTFATATIPPTVTVASASTVGCP